MIVHQWYFLIGLVSAVMKCILLAIGGALWLSVSGISAKMDDFEKTVASLGLGVTFSVLAGCISLFVGFRYVDLTTGGLLVVLFILFLAKNGIARPTLKLNLRKRYLVPITLCAVQIALIALYLHTFPIFPNNDAMDIVWHISLTNAVLHGQAVAPLTELGSHALFAYIYSFVGGVLLESVRVTAGGVGALSVLVAYCMFFRLFRRYEYAEYATIAFSLIMPAELVYYTGIGAYANIVGDFFVLLSLLFFLIAIRDVSIPSILTLTVVQGVTLISHISVLIFAGLMLGYSFFMIRYHGYRVRDLLVASIGFLIVPLLALAISPGIVMRELGYITTLNYVGVQNDPVLILTTWFTNYTFLAGPINFAIVLIALIMIILITKHWQKFPAAWFILLFFAIFIGSNGSRFILLSFVPAAGLIGFFLLSVQEYVTQLDRHRTSMTRQLRVLAGAMMICIILVMTATGPVPRIANETYVAEGKARERQLLIYESMAWLGSNASSTAIVVSVDLQKEYRYLPTLFNRTYLGDTFGCLYYQTQFDCVDNQSSSSLLNLARITHFNYVAVSTDFAKSQNYYQCGGLRAVFRNSQVVIFLIMDNPCNAAVA